MTATYIRPYPVSAALTKGRTYDVVDFNDYFDTVTITDDAGKPMTADRQRFLIEGAL